MPSYVSAKYRSTVTSSVLFRDSGGEPYDPAEVELHLGDDVFTLAGGDVERVAAGRYRYVWTAATPGRIRRQWVGRDPGDEGFYADTPLTVVDVQRPRA